MVTGYIDPGTGGSIFALLAPVLAGLAVFIGFLFRPIKRFIKFIISKFRKK